MKRMYWKTSEQPAILYVELDNRSFVPYTSLPAAMAGLSTPDHLIPAVTGYTSESSGSLGYATFQKLLRKGYTLVNENTITG